VNRRPSAAGAVLPIAVAAVGVLAAVVTVAPSWVSVLLTGVVSVAWALWATCPPGTSLGRHLAAQAGRVVLDAVRAVVRTVLTVVVVIALLVAGWSAIAPRLAGYVDHQVDRTLGRATDTVTSRAGMPDLGRRVWDHLTKETAR